MKAAEKYRTLAEDLRRRAEMRAFADTREQALALARHFEALAAEVENTPNYDEPLSLRGAERGQSIARPFRRALAHPEVA